MANNATRASRIDMSGINQQDIEHGFELCLDTAAGQRTLNDAQQMLVCKVMFGFFMGAKRHHEQAKRNYVLFAVGVAAALAWGFYLGRVL